VRVRSQQEVRRVSDASSWACQRKTQMSTHLNDHILIIEGEDTARLADSLRAWRGEFIPLAPGKSERSGAALTLQNTHITKLRLSRPVLMRGVFARGWSTLLFTTPDPAPARVSTRALTLHEGIALGHLAPIEIYLPARCGLCVVSVKPNCSMLSSTTGANLPNAGVVQMRTLSESLQRELIQLMTLMDDLRDSSLAVQDTTAQRIERRAEGLSSRLFAETSATSVVPGEKSIRHLAVQRACAFIDTHLAESITLADLCEAAGARPRTLEYGFREFFDVGPMTYLRSVRLCRVRRDLSNPGADSSVTAIARRWCFSHMGQFSRDYRLWFGEIPSVTLARARGVLVKPSARPSS
jgi:AraC-like DNA-binding protein